MIKIARARRAGRGLRYDATDLGKNELRKAMAKITRNPTSIGTDDTIYAVVHGTPEKPWDPTFDSYMTKNSGQKENCRLKILLRVFLKPDIPRWEEDLLMRQIEFEKNKFRSDAERVNYATNRRIGIRHDANQRRFATKSWAPDEWLTFVDAFVRQSSAWNRKFWLIPPPYFSLFDFKHRQSTIRPNIACEFELAIVGENGNPHNKVEAINLYVFDAFFRPNATRLSSRAVDIRTMSSVDAAGLERDHKNYSTIAHEVGHMLGLRHIGMTRDLANCELAMVLDKQLEQDVIPAIWKGGANAGVCYGDRSSAGDADNVMGIGGEFAVENARPWQNRLVEHMKGADFNVWDWTVSMKEAPPKLVTANK